MPFSFSPWLSLARPMTVSLWLGNRLTTWAGLVWFWRRFRSHRLVWVWIVLLNVVSFGALIAVCLWLTHHRHP